MRIFAVIWHLFGVLIAVCALVMTLVCASVGDWPLAALNAVVAALTANIAVPELLRALQAQDRE